MLRELENKLKDIVWRGVLWLRSKAWWQRVRSAVAWAARLGTQGYPPDTRRRLVVMNLIAYLIAFSTAGYALQHLFTDRETYWPVIVINLLLVPTAVAVPFCHRFGELAGGLFILVTEFAALMAFTYYLGRTSGVHIQYFVFAAATFVVFGVHRWRLIVPLVLTALGLHLYAWFNFPPEAAAIPPDPEIVDGIYAQAAGTTVILTAAAVWYAFQLAEHAKAETDALLRNILPDNVVERLKVDPGSGIADSFDDASILFADISGFVALARELGAARTVELLNRIVMRFDALAEEHGVEKIKTIGDAYMVAAGIPEPVPNHTRRLANMGLDMLEILKELRDETGYELRMRVGLASGPVMAGVIGTRKFTYDVWGDAVNLAARLENKSAPGRILICPNCKSRLEGYFDLKKREAIEIKGVGLQETWYILGRREDASEIPKIQSGDEHETKEGRVRKALAWVRRSGLLRAGKNV